MQNPGVIEVRNLSFGYGNEPILEKIGLKVNKGDFAAVIGSNGAGKSTLLRLVLGELAPSAGDIRLFGQDIRSFKDWPKIGYVPQTGLQSAVNFPATAEEIVKANLFSKIGLMRFSRKEHLKKARKALELVDMAACSKRLIGELSGGQRQRIMLARVLVSDPEIMLLDEPIAGVDAQTVQSLYELLAKLNRETGLTIIMVTHDIGRASGFVSKIFCLEEGSLVELDRTQVEEELSHKHKHPARGCQIIREGGDGDGRDSRI